MDQSEIYQQHLDRVSRSFAFCIRQLKEPLKQRVGLAYILCRILDTLEDAGPDEIKTKLVYLSQFAELVQSPSPSQQTYVSEWLRQISPQAASDGEKSLLLESSRFLKDLHGLPVAPRKIIQDAVLSMSRGMAYFLKQSTNQNALILASLADVNRYCFFVAGVVGEMLTRLVALSSPAFRTDGDTLLRAHHFGLFLQKINLLKDRLEDAKAGRDLIPPSVDLKITLDANMKGALEYLISIPLEEREYRIFCGWSLFLGLASLPWIEKSWAKKIAEKIPRAAAEAVLARVTNGIDDNQKLLELFNSLKPTFDYETPAPVSASETEFAEFQSLYHGTLSNSHLAQLAMIR